MSDKRSPLAQLVEAEAMAARLFEGHRRMEQRAMAAEALAEQLGQALCQAVNQLEHGELTAAGAGLRESRERYLLWRKRHGH